MDRFLLGTLAIILSLVTIIASVSLNNEKDYEKRKVFKFMIWAGLAGIVLMYITEGILSE